jgi:tRNA dimethylallyltransferase
MDVGTAKPTPAEQARARHHLIDLVDPDEGYSVARFLDDAGRAIAEVAARGRRPIVVGGTGYWVSALLGGATSAGVRPNEPLRVELAGQPAEALAARLAELDPAAAAAIDRRNPRRLIRAIEVVTATGRPFAEARQARPAAAGARLIGLTIERPALYARIDRRYDQMVAAGWLDEVRSLLARGYRRDLPSMSSLGYREIAAHLAGELSLELALARAKARCHRYARTQYGWFRLDDPRIEWVEAGPGADERIERLVGERAA